MSCRRCSVCDIDYPNDENTCHVCDRETWGNSDDYDVDWPDKVETLIKRAAIDNLEGIPDADINILNHRGRLWAAEEMLEAEGYVCRSLGVVKIRGAFYELSGRRSGEIPAWWLELIEQYPDWLRELPTLSEFDYNELEQKRGIR